MRYFIFQISVLGSENVGKKTLAKSRFSDSSGDVGDMELMGMVFALKTVKIEDTIVKLNFWIFSRKQHWWDNTRKINLGIHVRRSHGAIILYDIANPESLELIPQWIQIVKDNAGDIPIILVGNKADLNKQRKISKEQVEKIKKECDIKASIEISVITGENVEKMIIDLTSLMLTLCKDELELSIESLDVEKGELSPEGYRQFLEKIGQVKHSAISITNKTSRNEKAIIGFVHALREYYWLKDDLKFPYEKDHFPKKIKALYKLIYNELLKPPNIPVRWALDDKRRIVENIRKVLGEENTEYFIKKYKVNRLLRLKFEDTKYYKYYAICWAITVIVLLTIFFAQRL